MPIVVGDESTVREEGFFFFPSIWMPTVQQDFDKLRSQTTLFIFFWEKYEHHCQKPLLENWKNLTH